jgi:hypothetical protein
MVVITVRIGTLCVIGVAVKTFIYSIERRLKINRDAKLRNPLCSLRTAWRTKGAMANADRTISPKDVDSKCEPIVVLGVLCDCRSGLLGCCT